MLDLSSATQCVASPFFNESRHASFILLHDRRKLLTSSDEHSRAIMLWVSSGSFNIVCNGDEAHSVSSAKRKQWEKPNYIEHSINTNNYSTVPSPI